MTEPTPYLQDVTGRLLVKAFGCWLPISREMALEQGLIEPTEEERREQVEREARWEERRQRNLTATTQWLRALVTITDPLSRALLAMHSRSFDGNTCAECFSGGDGGDLADWPCNTVRLITAHHGHPAPEWCEF